jgi:rSAM/selenodomain-associated transferase 1
VGIIGGMDLLVLAKEPRPGRVKTRLTPPCSPLEAAAIAEAALADTLAAAVASGAERVVVALDGALGAWCPPGVSVVDQGVGHLADRLATAWRATSGPALQIGMDTPQLDASSLDAAMARLDADRCDAVLGLAEDGGWWGIGLREPHPQTFTGIAASRPDTGARQRARLAALGLRTDLLSVERDVDEWEDALAVAAAAPGGAFAHAVRTVQAGLAR